MTPETSPSTTTIRLFTVEEAADALKPAQGLDLSTNPSKCNSLSSYRQIRPFHQRI